MSILKIFSVKSRETPKARVSPPAESRAHEHVRLSNPWHAVALVPGTHACAAVKALAGKRFLSSESPPTVPLKDCPMATCTCRYRHYNDRRSSVSRSSGELPPSSAPALPRRRADDLVPR